MRPTTPDIGELVTAPALRQECRSDSQGQPEAIPEPHGAAIVETSLARWLADVALNAPERRPAVPLPDPPRRVDRALRVAAHGWKPRPLELDPHLKPWRNCADLRVELTIADLLATVAGLASERVDFTVPSEQPMTAAVSATDKPTK